jgi:hypothetical protein
MPDPDALMPPVPPEEDTYPAEAIARGPRRRWILDFAKRGGIGAEFGVFRGHFAAEIADHLRPARLSLVDTWTTAGERFDWGEVPETNFDRLTTFQALADTRARMAPFRRHTEIEIVEDTTVGFCARRSSRLDFAYLDTGHRYASTLAELEAIAAVIADDGVIMGDDWITDPSHPHAGVLRAVNDFIRLRDFELVAAGPEMQWCIRKTPRYPDPRRGSADPLAPAVHAPGLSPATPPTPPGPPTGRA